MLRPFFYALFLLLAMSYGALLFLARKFGNASLSSILSTLYDCHITFNSLDSQIALHFMRYALFWPVTIVFCLMLVDYLIRNYFPRFIKPCLVLLHLPIAAFFVVQGLSLYKKCFVYEAHMAKLVDEQKKKFGHQDIFKRLYVPPKQVVRTPLPSPQRNIIVLYIESLERTYSNPKRFQKNLLAALDTPDIPYQDLPRLRQVNGTGWSIAGIVASQCGVPLIVRFGMGNIIGSLGDNFLSSAVCLSDIFSLQGYNTAFLKDGALQFAGFGNFTKAHRIALAHGFEHWETMGYRTGNPFGLDDDILFSKAKQFVVSKLKKKQKFYLFMLTANTHGSKGWLDSYCRKSGRHNFQGIVQCAAEETRDFLQFIFQHDPNAIVLVTGDHLAMKNPVSSIIEQQRERYVFTRLYGKNLPKIRTQYSTHFDIFPLMLAASGIAIPGGKLGLGHNPFTVAQNNDAKYLALLNYVGGTPSTSYRKLWKKTE